MHIVRSGELTLAAAQGLIAELRTGFQGSEPVRLELEGVTEVDFACLQILWSAERSFAGCGRPLHIEESECIRLAWTAAGLRPREGENG